MSPDQLLKLKLRVTVACGSINGLVPLFTMNDPAIAFATQKQVGAIPTVRWDEFVSDYNLYKGTQGIGDSFDPFPEGVTDSHAEAVVAGQAVPDEVMAKIKTWARIPDGLEAKIKDLANAS